MKFKLQAPFTPTGDQPEAIAKLVEGLKKGDKHQTLLGVTGSGKTFTIANVVERIQKPTLVISHNKTLAGQLYQEFRDFFPKNSINYFVSYYDYYQPEAYIPQTDTYIEKETEINEEIDKLRLATTTALQTRDDVLVVASVSCIYNLGSPEEYGKFIIPLSVGQIWQRLDLLRQLAYLQYSRSEDDFRRGTFRVRGENIEVFPSYESQGLRLYFAGEKLAKLVRIDPISGNKIEEIDSFTLYPAKHYVTSQDTLKAAIGQIKIDLVAQEKFLKSQGKDLFAHRLHQRTMYDFEQMREFGYCTGIENYSRYFDGRTPGEPPYTLLDYFSRDFLLIIDDSHMTIPQIRGMYNGDRSRKGTLIEFGFRLPSALDNRPLRYEEFARKISKTRLPTPDGESHGGQAIYTSATPDQYEISLSAQVVEQLVRPTGLLDPEVEIRPTEGQIDDLIAEIEKRVKKRQRVLVTTLTKRMAEELARFLEERGIKVHYLHSEIETLDRQDILDDLRSGVFDVVVGINLLREGLDLPEVSLVAILDADKEGFLRSQTSLIQTMGRAARHQEGKVIMYADDLTGSMKRAITEVDRRRNIQLAYNKKHHITPKSITKPIRQKLVEREKKDEYRKILFKDAVIDEALRRAEEGTLLADDREKLIKILNREMREAARLLDFEKAAILRDQIVQLKVNQ